MIQEIEVKLLVNADVSLSKEDIKAKIEDMLNFSTLHSTTHDRMMIPKIEIKEIREESEIYNTETNECNNNS